MRQGNVVYRIVPIPAHGTVGMVPRQLNVVRGETKWPRIQTFTAIVTLKYLHMNSDTDTHSYIEI